MRAWRTDQSTYGAAPRFARSRVAVALMSVTGFGALLIGSAKAVMPSPPAGATGVSAAQPSLAPELEVSWAPGAGATATGATVVLWAETALGIWRLEGSNSCTASCRSVTFRYLQFGTTYKAAVTLTNSYGSGPAVTSSPILLSNDCPHQLCFTVESEKPIEPASHQAAGILHSFDGSPARAERLSQLGVTMWRSSSDDGDGGAGPWAVAQTEHIPTTFVLSDKWFTDTQGGTITPWSDWNNYRNWVIASVRQLQQSGIQIDYWEVYNEPDNVTTDYYPPAEAASVTASNLLTQFLVAYQAIRSVLPNAQIIGPSASGWVENGSPSMFSMAEFLDFAASNNLSLAALSWHYNARNPRTIVDEAAEARTLIDARPAVGYPKIFVNEYGTPGTQRIPGWDLQYLSALTDSKVDSAGRSCWGSDCSLPALDGLLSPDGSATFPDFWVWAFYAQMTGNMVETSANSDSAAALASIDDANSTIRIMVGLGHSCLQDLRCVADGRPALPSPPMLSQVMVAVPWSSGQVIVSESRIPGTTVSPTSEPAARNIGTLPIADQSGQSVVNIDTGILADGDVFSLTLTHVN